MPVGTRLESESVFPCGLSFQPRFSHWFFLSFFPSDWKYSVGLDLEYGPDLLRVS